MESFSVLERFHVASNVIVLDLRLSSELLMLIFVFFFSFLPMDRKFLHV